MGLADVRRQLRDRRGTPSVSDFLRNPAAGHAAHSAELPRDRTGPAAIAASGAYAKAEGAGARKAAAAGAGVPGCETHRAARVARTEASAAGDRTAKSGAQQFRTRGTQTGWGSAAGSDPHG